MKFYSITSRKLKAPLIFLLVTVLTNVFQAQNHAISPYSRFGVGDLQPIQTPRNVAMGGLSVGLSSPLSITSRNPATFRNLDSLMVNFEVTMHSIMSRLQENQNINGEETTLSARSTRSSLGQISFAFPITNWLGAGFGLTPATNMNYNVSREFGRGDTILGTRVLNHQGNGGLNQVFFGVGIGTDRISVGANFNYQFGMFTRNTLMSLFNYLILNDSVQVPMLTATTENLTEVSVGGFFIDLGAIQTTAERPFCAWFRPNLPTKIQPKCHTRFRVAFQLGRRNFRYDCIRIWCRRLNPNAGYVDGWLVV